MQILQITLSKLSETERRAMVIHLAERLGVHQTTIYRWARGATSPSHPIIAEHLIFQIEMYTKEFLNQ